MTNGINAHYSNHFDVFISYASVDREPVELFVQKLKLDNFRVWFDIEQIVRGPTTLGQLADGIANSSHMIACLSDPYIEREFTVFELQTNLSFDPTNRGNRTIPVKIRPLSKPIPTIIQALAYGDLTDVSTCDAEYQRITRLIQRNRPKPEPTELDRETLERRCEAPFRYLDEPNVALFQARMAAEAICQFLHRQEVGEPPGNSTFDSLVQRLLSVGRLPTPIKMSLSTVQTYGNFVVKDQMGDYAITQESIQPGLAALKVLSDWTFAAYLGQPKKEYIWDSIWEQLPSLEDVNEREIPDSRFILRAPRQSLNTLGPLYAGRDKQWCQSVAINLVALSEEQEATFFEEVSQFIRLNEASLIRPLDAGKVVVDGKRLCAYVILEHVDGASAQDLFERFGALPALAACELCRDVAMALQGLHAADPAIVHSDIKPANVLVGRYGTVKVLCIGRSTAVTAEDASSGAAGGKIDSFLFASPEQLSGTKKLTPKTDLFALSATLFYLLTGEYEARIRGSDWTADLPAAAVEALERLAACATAGEARDILDLACQRLAGDSVNLRVVIDCYREDDELPKPSEGLPAPAPTPKSRPVDFSRLTAFPVASRKAWPLGGGRILVWEAGADTLAILEGSELLWRDSQPMRIRKVERGPEDELAAISWDGQVRCFEGGELSAAITLPGAVGDARFCAGRWIVGTWKHSLVSIGTRTDVLPLLDVEKGVFRIAVMDEGDRFAVADLGSGIAFYSGGRKVAEIAPLSHGVASMAFAGRRLMVISGGFLVAFDWGGIEVARESLRGHLLPSPYSGHCLLLTGSGDSRLIDESGAQLPYFTFPAKHVLLSLCRISKRFTLALPEGGCAYWRNGEQQLAWPDAITANLSPDGRFVAITFPGEVQLYEDPK